MRWCAAVDAVGLTVACGVQGAWGGGLLMSRKHRHKLNGVERYKHNTTNTQKSVVLNEIRQVWSVSPTLAGSFYPG